MQPLPCEVLDAFSALQAVELALLSFLACQMRPVVLVLKWKGKILILLGSRPLFLYSEVLEYRSRTDKILRHSTIKINSGRWVVNWRRVLGWILLSVFCSILEHFSCFSNLLLLYC